MQNIYIYIFCITRGCFAGEKETWNTVPNLAFLPNPSGPIEGSRNHIANANGVR